MPVLTGLRGVEGDIFAHPLQHVFDVDQRLKATLLERQFLGTAPLGGERRLGSHAARIASPVDQVVVVQRRAQLA